MWLFVLAHSIWCSVDLGVADAHRSVPGHTISIDFPDEIFLDVPPKPALLRARWVDDPESDNDQAGPGLWPWVSRGTVEGWRRLPNSNVFEGRWVFGENVQRGEMVVVVSTDERGPLEWSAASVDVAAPLAVVLGSGGLHLPADAAVELRVLGETLWRGSFGGPTPVVALPAKSVHATLIETATSREHRIVLPKPRRDLLAIACPRQKLKAGEVMPLGVVSEVDQSGSVVWSTSLGSIAVAPDNTKRAWLKTKKSPGAAMETVRQATDLAAVITARSAVASASCHVLVER